MSSKIIYLAYANSEQNPLPTLSKEFERVHNTLFNVAKKGNFSLYPERFATIDKVNDFLHEHGSSIMLFHFSGHADGKTILLDDSEANSKGIAYQLKTSAQKGVLKLVVLNGCSTVEQVKRLLEYGIPAIIATHALVNDYSATEFAIRFYQNLCKTYMTIKDAFRDALGRAQTDTPLNLGEFNKPVRHLTFIDEEKANTALWELFCQNQNDVDINPLFISTIQQYPNYMPNELLIHTIYKSLNAAGCGLIQALENQVEANIIDTVDLTKKRSTILEALPFPIATHVQQLFLHNQISLKRLHHIGMVYHIIMEFLSFIMIAQLWELKLNNVAVSLPKTLVQAISHYFYLSAQDRSTFDYLPFIRSIREYFDTLNQGSGVKYFVEELETLKELYKEGKNFSEACDYLTYIHTRIMNNNMDEQKATELCIEAEGMLCKFFQELGFVHRYKLTSVQKIDILKYRHSLQALFKHQVVKLMDSYGTPEPDYYFMPTFLDTNGVILTKHTLKIINRDKHQYQTDRLEFLNLSPFVIDRNAFEQGTNRSNLMFFEQFQKSDNRPESESISTYFFKGVRHPEKKEDGIQVTNEEQYEALRLQFEAFRLMILNEDR